MTAASADDGHLQGLEHGADGAREEREVGLEEFAEARSRCSSCGWRPISRSMPPIAGMQVAMVNAANASATRVVRTRDVGFFGTTSGRGWLVMFRARPSAGSDDRRSARSRDRWPQRPDRRRRPLRHAVRSCRTVYWRASPMVDVTSTVSRSSRLTRRRSSSTACAVRGVEARDGLIQQPDARLLVRALAIATRCRRADRRGSTPSQHPDRVQGTQRRFVLRARHPEQRPPRGRVREAAHEHVAVHISRSARLNPWKIMPM